MQTIKGFTEKEITVLSARVEEAKKQNRHLSQVFEQFAREYGRAKGSVRNFYYDFVKMCGKDAVLRERFFATQPCVNKVKSFDEGETRFLIRKILIGKKLNKSVRRTIIELAGGDERLSLRYQNKYRNVLKTSPSLVKEIADELGVEEDVYLSSKTTKVPEITLKRLKTSINTLVENIAKTARDEANSLKERNRILEAENTALREMLISRTQDKIKSYTLKQNEEKRFIN